MNIVTVLLQISLLTSISLSMGSHSPSPAQRSSPVAVGEVAPDFTLQDQNAQQITLADARGKSPVVVVFYRGYW